MGACCRDQPTRPGRLTQGGIVVAMDREMTGNTSITLGEHFDAFVKQQLANGRYGNASEVVRAGLRMLEEHEQRCAALRQALLDGATSGDAGPLDMEAIKSRARKLAGLASRDG